MLPPEGRDLILAGAIISIFLNPLIFALIVAHPEPAEPEEKAPKAIAAKGHVILIGRSEEHTSELQSLMRISYAVFCLKKKHNIKITQHNTDSNTHNIVHKRI